MSTQTNKAIVHRMLQQVWNQRRLDLSGEFFTDEVAFHVAGMPTATGLEGLEEATAVGLNAFPDIQIAVDEVIAEGNTVVVRATSTGTHQGELMGIPATGKQVIQSIIAVYHFSEAKISQLWFSADNLSLMQQLGVVPMPDAA